MNMVKSEKRGTKALEAWCKKITSQYQNAMINNMTTSWRNGLAFCAIIHHFRPDLIDYHSLNSNDILENNKLAFNTAEQHLGITSLLDPEDMVQYPVPDRLSILTYVSQFYKYFESEEFKASYGMSAEKFGQNDDRKPDDAQMVEEIKFSDDPERTHTEMCCKCNESVFLVERLVVDCKLYHRTCFRCSRCGVQMNIVNYTLSVDGDYCCEVCPDEESICSWNEEVSNSTVFQEKSIGIDNYSSNLEISLGDNQEEEANPKLVDSSNSKTDGKEKMPIQNEEFTSGIDDAEGKSEASINHVQENDAPVICIENIPEGEDDAECVTGIAHLEQVVEILENPVAEVVESPSTVEVGSANGVDELTDISPNSSLLVKNLATLSVNAIDVVNTESTNLSSASLSNPFADDSLSEYPDDLNPFGDPDTPVEQAKSSNPFGTDGESEEDNSSVKVNPVPKPPRAAFNKTIPKDHNRVTQSDKSLGTQRRKKRPAPEPPRSGQESLETSPYSSLNSTPMKGSPCGSIRKSYKNKLAPIPPGSKYDQSLQIPGSGKGDFGTWKKKRPAPPRPFPPKRKVKALPFKEIQQESYDIEVQQAELERQGISLEKGVRELSENDSSDPRLEDLTVQLFDVINMKNELFRRQTELMYLKKERRLEEEHAELEYQIRCLLEKPDDAKSDLERDREEKLIDRLVQVVQMRNDIVDALEMDRKKDGPDDSGISESLSGRESVISNIVKKKKKWKRKLKFKHSSRTEDLDKTTISEKDNSIKVKKKHKWLSKLS